MIRVWEIVGTTPHFYDIQPREIPNKQAMKSTTRIRRGDVCIENNKAKYYLSKGQLIECEREFCEKQIARDIRRIELNKQKIANLNRLEGELQ